MCHELQIKAVASDVVYESRPGLTYPRPEHRQQHQVVTAHDSPIDDPPQAHQKRDRHRRSYACDSRISPGPLQLKKTSPSLPSISSELDSSARCLIFGRPSLCDEAHQRPTPALRFREFFLVSTTALPWNVPVAHPSYSTLRLRTVMQTGFAMLEVGFELH